MKKVYKLTILVITLILIAAILLLYAVKLTSKVNLLELFPSSKLTSLKNIHISGKEGKNRRWEIWAKEGWTGRDKNRTYLENVSRCIVYEDEYPVVKDLTARRVIANSLNRDIEVFKTVDGSGWLSAKIDFNKTNNKDDYSTLHADYIKFSPKTDKALIKGNITIVKNDLTIEANEIIFDTDKNIANIIGKSRYTKDDDLIIGDNAKAYLSKDEIIISSIEVYQDNKTAYARSGTLNDKNRTLILNKNVKAIIEKAEEALKNTSAEKARSEEMKKALKAKTVITSDQMTLNVDDKNFTAKGNVFVVQKEQSAKSNFAVYNEDKEEIVMTGNVFMKRKDQWIKTEKIIVSVNDETFHAIGAVETEIIFKK